MKKTKFKDMPTQKDIRTFINERLSMGKINRIISYNKQAVIFDIKMQPGNTYFCFEYGYIQSICTVSERPRIVYVIPNRDYKYMLSEIEFWRWEQSRVNKRIEKDPNYQPKRPCKFTVI